ncbi:MULTISPECIES: hypothetical protein [Gracilibacillus]|uniref:hypothetical protein n=1 Tax=Gracilibacillus TaxID=74385 RepID=UPI000826FBFE|nr:MULTISPECIES: hypothetical protein [Gracilibacillus]
METYYSVDPYMYDANIETRPVSWLPFPPFGQGGPGGAPPFVSPGQGPPQAPPPPGPPPNQIPQVMSGPGGAQVLAVDSGSMRRCLFRYTYIWESPRRGFWFYPTFLGRRSVAGYRWTGFNWIYFGVDLNRIQSFTCV